ncbi:ATP-dependent helicase [Nakamurella sp.]|uniref:ATP-dependent helicase n=1 Tax=Nakamurella sp. TaxID=1869182 RepID=UPI003B3BB462
MITAIELAHALGLPAPTPEQAAVIEAPLVPGLVVAGAGSGKTETMAARVVYLVATGQVRPEQVLGLTFTRKAAAALSQRIRRRLAMLPSARTGVAPVDAGTLVGDPDVSTYHAFGGRLIADFGPLAGVEPAARVLTPTGAWQLARRVVGRWDADLLTDLGPDQVTERLLAISSALADHLTDVEALSDELSTVLARLRSAPPGPRQRQPLHSGLTGPVKRLQDRQWILPLVQAYVRAKREQGVVDFADQMQLAADLVRDHPRIAAAMRDRYRVVLLDEYQDTGHAQRVILRGLFGAGVAQGAGEGPASGSPRGGHPVTAVGDPVQSIYSWRGASASNLPRFVTDFPLASGRPSGVRPLLTSFRNPAAVLGLANEISAPVRGGGAVEVGELRPAPGAPVGEIRYGLFATAAQENAWLAGAIAGFWERARQQDGAAAEPPTTAVLVRRRSDMADTADALRSAGLPVEVVGLGGLLDEPEIADLVATLRILVDPTAGSAVIRLLTGARWQLGAADLEALAARARELAAPAIATATDPAASGAAGRDPGPGAGPPDGAVADRPSPGPPGGTGSSAAGSSAVGSSGDRVSGDRVSGDAAGSAAAAGVRAAVSAALPVEDIDTWSLVDAAADPGPAEGYSPRGYRRLLRFAGQLARLRARVAQPLPDLIADLERVSLLDVEALVAGPAARAHLDAFGAVVAEVAATGAGPAELLDYLDAAAEREDGLTPGEVPQPSGRVQVLTVHAAKGLEWEIVAVPHLTAGVFPITRGSTWLGDPAQLPPQLRGDRIDLPQLDLPADGTQKDLADALTAHTADFGDLRLTEERRLLYVALTRTERTLLFSGHHWGPGTAKPAGPSDFLLECAQWARSVAEPDEWADAPDPQEAAVLPPRTATWPVDPLGRRRDAVQAGAARVVDALTVLADRTDHGDAAVGARRVDVVRPTDLDAPPPGPATRAAPDPDPFGWSADVTTLLTERAARSGPVLDVDLPGTITVTSLVELADDPAELARRLSRPLPAEPSGRLRRGSEFHAWLEHRFRGDALLDLRDLPGAGDAWVGEDPELELLKRRFLESAWADRVPVDVEVPFATRIAGMGVRGRVDAIFADPDGGVTVVDWKTGRPPDRQEPAAVQLACYRLAIAELLALPLDQVRAAFHYVRAGSTVAPADLLDATGIADLIAARTVAPAGRS